LFNNDLEIFWIGEVDRYDKVEDIPLDGWQLTRIRALKKLFILSQSAGSSLAVALAAD
jgi:hypothetical protein